MEDAFSLRLFGGFEARSNGRLLQFRSKKARHILVLLALRCGKDTERDHLCRVLWPDSDAKQGRYNLRRSLSELRCDLQENGHRIVSDRYETVRLNIEKSTIDALTFDQLIARREIEPLEQAISLYRGPLLAECAEEWIEDERAFREQRYGSALETLADLYIAQGDHNEAIRCLRLLTHHAPYSESAVRKLMIALAAVGDRAEISRCYRELCNRLRATMATEPAVETKSLWEQLMSKAETVVSFSGLNSLPGNPAAVLPAPARDSSYLPRILTPLIGRDEDVEGATTAVNRAPLVTLIGPGGVGKTCLALAVGKRVPVRFPDGIWFIDLAPVTKGDAVLPTLLQSLGRRCSPDCSDLTIIEEFLRPRQSLLILDNCEHLTPTVAQVVRHLLEQCPYLKILATSRHSIGVAGEQRYFVHPLPVPPAGLLARIAAPGFEEKNIAGVLMEYPAVRLFVERVRQIRPQISLNNENALTAAHICVQLEGLPLALELAAARVNVLSLNQIAARLENQFHLIMGSERQAGRRHETLRALLDWSYGLLTEPEQVLLQRLSIFSRGATLDAVETICSSANLSAEDILNLLGCLADKSLVRFQEGAGSDRYHLLETVREYAREKQEASGDGDETGMRHLRYFLAFAYDTWNLPIAEGVQALEAEYDNIRAALEFALNRPGCEKEALDLVSALQRFWEVRGYLTEARKYLRQALALSGPQAKSVSRIRALRVCANFERLSGDKPFPVPLPSAL